MFFLTSKLMLWVLQPLVLVLIALLWSLWCFRRGRAATGKRLVLASAMATVVVGISPLSTVMLLLLEERFPRPILPADATVAGVIVLGGAEESRITQARGVANLNDAAERMTEALALARRFPQARIVFTSGTTEIVRNATVGTDSARQFFGEQGLDMSRLVLESRSRNTHENAVFTSELVRHRPDETWLLVTSAFHMPRSMGAFRATGWEVVPWPVDYRTEGWQDAAMPFFNPLEGFRRMELAGREWVGLAAYRLTGRSASFFPGPRGARIPVTP